MILHQNIFLFYYNKKDMYIFLIESIQFICIKLQFENGLCK